MAPKHKQNAFAIFMMELRRKDPKRFVHMKQLQHYAGQQWASFSAERKAKYKVLAAKSNGTYGGTRSAEPSAAEEAENEKREKIQSDSQMRDAIRKIMQVATYFDTLKSEVFLLCHTNFYLKSDKIAVCEVAIAALTLEDGVVNEDVFHRIVKSGRLPMGYRHEANQISSKSHQLIDLVYDADPYVYNLDSVFHDMYSFVKKYSKGGNLPPLYVSTEDIELTQEALDDWCEHFKSAEKFTFYSLQHMFFVLRNSVARKAIWPHDGICYDELRKDTFAYTTGISCEVHENCDAFFHCSKSIVIRTAYVICNFCCPDLNIHILPGCHIPVHLLNIADINKSFSTKLELSEKRERDDDIAGCSSSVKCYDSLPHYTGRFSSAEASICTMVPISFDNNKRQSDMDIDSKLNVKRIKVEENEEEDPNRATEKYSLPTNADGFF